MDGVGGSIQSVGQFTEVRGRAAVPIAKAPWTEAGTSVVERLSPLHHIRSFPLRGRSAQGLGDVWQNEASLSLSFARRQCMDSPRRGRSGR